MGCRLACITDISVGCVSWHSRPPPLYLIIKKAADEMEAQEARQLTRYLTKAHVCAHLVKTQDWATKWPVVDSMDPLSKCLVEMNNVLLN